MLKSPIKTRFMSKLYKKRVSIDIYIRNFQHEGTTLFPQWICSGSKYHKTYYTWQLHCKAKTFAVPTLKLHIKHFFQHSDISEVPFTRNPPGGIRTIGYQILGSINYLREEGGKIDWLIEHVFIKCFSRNPNTLKFQALE